MKLLLASITIKTDRREIHCSPNIIQTKHTGARATADPPSLQHVLLGEVSGAVAIIKSVHGAESVALMFVIKVGVIAGAHVCSCCPVYKSGGIAHVII